MSAKQIDTNGVKKAISRLEYYNYGVCDEGHIRVTNLKIRKRKPTTADVTVCSGSRTTVYRGCEYDIDILNG